MFDHTMTSYTAKSRETIFHPKFKIYSKWSETRKKDMPPVPPNFLRRVPVYNFFRTRGPFPFSSNTEFRKIRIKNNVVVTFGANWLTA